MLPHPWDSPGKNTGVGCHFLFQRMKVKRESEVAQSCLTLSDPMDWSLPGSSAHGIFQARVLEWVPLPSPRSGQVQTIARHPHSPLLFLLQPQTTYPNHTSTLAYDEAASLAIFRKPAVQMRNKPSNFIHASHTGLKSQSSSSSYHSHPVLPWWLFC